MTLSKDELDSIAAELVRAGVLTSTVVVADKAPQMVSGLATVAGAPTRLSVALDADFPTSLPLVFLADDWGKTHHIPHVMFDRLVCWAESGSLRWDPTDVAGIARVAVEEAVRTLEDGLAKRNHKDFQDEFESYWSSWLVEANCYLEPGNEVRFAVAKKPKGGDLEIGSRATLVRLGVATPWETLEPVVFIPLIGAILPPRWDEVWTADHVRRLLIAVSRADRAMLRDLAKTEAPRLLHVVFQVQRPAGGESFCGLTLVNVEARAHPFSFGAEGWAVGRFNLIRANKEHLAARGGGHVELLGKRVLVVGCGAVGGHLAFELARAGVGNLTLVDSQKLALENVHRHVLGWRYAKRFKAAALKAAIRESLPFAEVQAVDKSLGRALADGDFRYSDFDLVVFAVGDPVVELDANRKLWPKVGSRVVFVWVDPLGLGGHAIRMAAGERGCLECTYRPMREGGDSLVSFAAPGQAFSRKLTGCGSSFTPYGSADAVQTAVLGARVVVETLLAGDVPSQVRSWKGNDAAMAGFKTSARWDEGGSLELDGGDYAQVQCPVCGQRR